MSGWERVRDPYAAVCRDVSAAAGGEAASIRIRFRYFVSTPAAARSMQSKSMPATMTIAIVNVRQKSTTAVINFYSLREAVPFNILSHRTLACDHAI